MFVNADYFGEFDIGLILLLLRYNIVESFKSYQLILLAMQTDFIERENWILPVEGTLGNKAQNLINNERIVKSHGFNIPRSLVIPYEYLQIVTSPTDFVLEQIDKYFPRWLRIFVRSNAPDEDLNYRFPGQYVSEHLWHTDRLPALQFIDNVLYSYTRPAPKLRRRQLGLPDLGMCLLIQEPVTNSPGEFDPSYSGCFSDIGELALLFFTNPAAGLDAMKSKPLKRYYVERDGTLRGDYFSLEQDLASRLRRLTYDLPTINGKGWEIEFVGNQNGAYVVQTTPIVKKTRVEIPTELDNVFNTIAVVGTDTIITDGILYVPFFIPTREHVVSFDVSNSNYALATDHINLTKDSDMLQYVVNPSVIIDLTTGFWRGHPFAPHIEQYMREGRIGIAGTFTGNLASILMTNSQRSRNQHQDENLGPFYSPTKLVVVADEVSQRGFVGLADKQLHDFVSLEKRIFL